MPPSIQASLWEAGVGREWVCRCKEERGQQAPRGREPVPVEHSSWGCGAGGWKPQCFPAAEAQRTPLGAKPKDEALWSFSRSLLRSRPGVASESLPLRFGGRP